MPIFTDNPRVLADRVVEKSAANLPQSTQSALFTVTGGKVIITRIDGEVTTVIESKLNNMKLVSNPTVGADVDMCAVVDINADAVGTIYNTTGTLTDALVATTSAVAEAQTNPFIVTAGTIDLSCSASSTGQVKWVVHWRPLDSGVTVT